MTRPNLTVIEGHARFASPTTVRVNDETLTSDKIFINVGGRASVPPFPGIDQIDYLTNSTIMEVDFLPEHLIIVGGSYIGLEFAQIYRRFGSRVTVVEKTPRIIGREDPDISEGVAAILRNEGVAIETGAECIRVEQRGDQIAVGLDCTGGAREVVGSYLLLAVGRVPNTDDLGLDKAGVAVDADTREILGAAILGVNGDEAVHGILDLMYAKAPYTVLQRAVHIHPTVSELIPTLLGELKPLE